MFPLTEAWAAEYLEVIVNLLVFALGIPALILQFAVPEQLRIVSSRRLKWLRYSAFVISVLTTLSALAFVWIRELHPYSSTSDSTNAGRAGASILTVVVVLILIFWLFQTKEHRRDAIVRRLQRRCRWGLRLRGFLPESCLLDLTYLGEQGDPGREKSQVLNAFDDLAARVQDREQYAGDGLADLVQGVETTVAGGAKTGDLNNFHQVAGVLEGILLRLGRQKRSAAPDAAAALLGDQPRLHQHLDVLRDRLQRDVERLGDLRYRQFPGIQPLENGAAHRIGKGREHQVEAGFRQIGDGYAGLMGGLVHVQPCG